jgi:hypothetical protein
MASTLLVKASTFFSYGNVKGNARKLQLFNFCNRNTSSVTDTSTCPIMGSHIKKGGAPSPKLFELPFVGSLITRQAHCLFCPNSEQKFLYYSLKIFKRRKYKSKSEGDDCLKSAPHFGFGFVRCQFVLC